jgi:guanylate kinase
MILLYDESDDFVIGSTYSKIGWITSPRIETVGLRDIGAVVNTLPIGIYEGAFMHLSNTFDSISSGFILDKILDEYPSFNGLFSSFNRRNNSESFPFILGLNFSDYNDYLGYPFKNSDLRGLMQSGVFACYEHPLTPHKYIDLANWLSLDSGDGAGKIIALTGTKTVGKTEVWNHMQSFHRRYKGLWKYSTRSMRADDIGDTKAMRYFYGQIKDHVHWGSYDNKCVISRYDLDTVLDSGKDVIVTIGNPDGLDSLREYYGDIVFPVLLTRQDDDIIDALDNRNRMKTKEKSVDIDKVLEVQESFQSYFNGILGYVVPSTSFFNVAREVEYTVSDFF